MTLLLPTPGLTRADLLIADSQILYIGVSINRGRLFHLFFFFII